MASVAILGGFNINDGVDPSKYTTDQLRKIRGSIWTARSNVPYGPRPNQDDNILAMDYYEQYTPFDRKRMINDYKSRQGYTHYPTGPLVDVGGYHGKYPSRPNIPTQAQWDAYLDSVQERWNAGLIPVHFVHPDGWSLEDMDQLEWMYIQPRAQRLLRIIVPTGWEPTKYDWKAQYWADIINKVKSWFAPVNQGRTYTLFYIHTVSDVDAPTGDGDNFPNGNAGAWEIVAPTIHGWLIQNGPYNTYPQDDPTTAANFSSQFDPNFPHSIAAHLKKGYAGWPTNSAWNNEPLDLIACEQTSYNAFWENLPEDASRSWGQLALESGADGAFDGFK